jgi:hypothetical protein
MEVVESFFSFVVANKWISESPGKHVKGARSKAAANQNERIPFTDEELKQMFEACEHRYGKTPIKWSRNVHHCPAQNETANYHMYGPESTLPISFPFPCIPACASRRTGLRTLRRGARTATQGLYVLHAQWRLALLVS